MKIRRVLNDTEFEIELTDRELRDAYFEQQFAFDKEDVLLALDDVLEHPEDYELPEGIKDNQELMSILMTEVKNAAVDMRRSIDKYGCSWDYARDEAVYELILWIRDYCNRKG